MNWIFWGLTNCLKYKLLKKTLFACLCGNGISVKDMSLKENSDDGFDVSVDLDVDEDYVDSLIFELNILGFD